jgi:phage shock protein A
MSILQRTFTIIRAKLSALVGRAENPRELAKLQILDGKQWILDKKENLVSLMAEIRVLEHDCALAQAAARAWQAKAERALDVQQRDLARACLQSKRGEEEKVQTYQAALEDMVPTVEGFKREIQLQERKLHDFQAKAEVQAVYQRLAEVQLALAGTLRSAAPPDLTGALAAWTRNNVRSEATARAHMQVAAQATERRLIELQATLEDDEIDAELDRMRAARLPQHS